MSTTTLTRPTTIPALLRVVGAGTPVPLVQGGSTAYTNLDYAASAPALASVAAHVGEVLPHYASVHRGAGYLSRVCTAAYEDARARVADFVGARADDVVVFTRNTTDALNLLAGAVPGEVVVLDVEHHANLLSWQRHGARVVAAGPTLAATLAALEAELRDRPAALVSVTGASNVTGECTPLAALAALAHRHGARIAVDAAQLAPHRRVSLAATGVDYLAFSGHKLYAPYGAGALVGRRDWLDVATPYLAGGGAVREVTVGHTAWSPAPARHEAGTPNVIGVTALAAACRALSALPPGALVDHERALTDRLVRGLAELGIAPLRIWADSTDVVGLVSFAVPGEPAGKVAAYLSAEHGIGVRDGRFCAHPLLDRLTGSAAVRVSFGVGTSSTDVDRLLSALESLCRNGTHWSYAADETGWSPTPETRTLPGWLGSTPLPSATDGCRPA